MDHARRFTARKIAKRIDLIRPMIHRRHRPIAPFRWTALPDATTPPPLDADPSGWDALPWNDYWAGQDVHFLIRSGFTVPVGWAEGPVALHLPMGVAGDIFTHPESLAYLDGRPWASADRHHHTIHLPERALDGLPHDLAFHGWTGLTGWPPDPRSRARLFMGECRLVEIDRRTRDFVSLAEVACELAQTMEDGRPERHAILTALDDAFLALDTRDPMGEAFWASVPRAMAVLDRGLDRAGAPLDVTLHAIGHAHMDVAYLWPTAQIRQKSARTSSNVLRMMEQHEGYRFSHSQPQLYDWMERDWPDLADAVAERVADGAWEPIGGMWVEPDTNIPGGEALVRQLLLGRTWFRERYGEGAETPVLWLPDTFGLSWCLPQLIAQAGLRWVVVNKASWNQYNPLPASTLWWEGIDGTRVLTQFLTTPREVQHLPFPTNYKSDLTAAEVVGTWKTSAPKEIVRDLPIAYGYGDGGGGPTGELIRRAKVWSGMPGAPRVRFSTVRDCMEAIEAQAARAPLWADELYLEGHRGTLTSQGWIKRANRRAEIAMLEAEFLMCATGTPAPEGWRAAWEVLCLNQFHDILPGTSVPVVFADARRDYARLSETTEAAVAACEGGAPASVPVAVANASPHRGPRLATLPDARGLPAGSFQPAPGGVLAHFPDLAPYSITAPAAAAAPEVPVAVAFLSDGGVEMANRWLRVRLDGEGRLVEVHDREHDRAVLDGVGNQLQAFEDRPLSWDAWDVDSFFEDRGEVVRGLTDMAVVADGPLRATVRLRWGFRSSLIVQDVSLSAHSRRIDFATEVDWHESHILLKAAFPVAVRAPGATYEIQWGSIRRRTHRNTSWDYAKFEVPAQRWADLSEGDYGVALLNDCKHGYDIRENVLRLSLIKSATSPDPGADQGRHAFTYALMPHGGDWREGVAREAADLNVPARALRAPADGRAFVEADRPGVVVEAIKPAEDGDGVILRLYESHRTRGPLALRFRDPPRSVVRSHLLEWEEGEAVALEDGVARLSIKPFEIVTLRVRW